MASMGHITYSLTEAPHFIRLVQFLADIEDHARLYADDDLQHLVDDCRDDLANLRRPA